MTRIFFAALFNLLIFVGGPAIAGSDRIGDIQIMDPWARATPPGAKNGAAYFSLMNKGTAADRLVGVASPVAKKAELHTHIKDGDIMRMRHVEAVPIGAGGMIVFKPGGYHVMLMGLKGPLKQGATFLLTLKFEKAGEMKVTVTVQKIGASRPSQMPMMKHDSPAGMHHGH